MAVESLCCTKVFTDSRFCGAVAMMEMSRMPLMAMFRVRGIGVAVSVRMSHSARSSLRRSLWRTPKRCSSSTMISPRSENDTLSCSS